MSDELLKSLSGYIDAIQGIGNSVAANIEKSILRLKDLELEIKQLERQRDITETEWDEVYKAMEAERAALETTLSPLREERRRLSEEIGDSVTKKADLKLESVRLMEENAKFKTYEEKAWKVLQAKESELLEREQALEQKENLRPRGKSLLPPIGAS